MFIISFSSICLPIRKPRPKTAFPLAPDADLSELNTDKEGTFPGATFIRLDLADVVEALDVAACMPRSVILLNCAMT